MNWVAKTDFPAPDGPAISRLSPSGTPPPSHRVQLGDPAREPPPFAGLLRPSGEAEGAGEGLQPISGDAERVQSWNGRLAPELHDLQLPHDRVPLDLLVQPEEPVGDGEHRVVADLPLGVLPDQEGGRLPARQVEGEPLDEGLEFHLAGPAPGLPHHRPERVHHDDDGARRLDLLDDLLQDRVQVVVQHDLAQVDKPDGGVQLGRVEELELLLVAEHLDGRLAQHGEVQGRPIRGGVGEHHLVGEGGLPAPGGPGDDVEGVLRQPAAQDLVQPRHPGRQVPDRHPFFAHGCPSALRSVSSTGASGHASRTRPSVRGSPMNVTSSPSSWTTTTAPASPPWAAPC